MHRLLSINGLALDPANVWRGAGGLSLVPHVAGPHHTESVCKLLAVFQCPSHRQAWDKHGPRLQPSKILSLFRTDSLCSHCSADLLGNPAHHSASSCAHKTLHKVHSPYKGWFHSLRSSPRPSTPAPVCSAECGGCRWAFLLGPLLFL